MWMYGVKKTYCRPVIKFVHITFLQFVAQGITCYKLSPYVTTLIKVALHFIPVTLNQTNS